MIKHIVMWKFKDEACGLSKEENLKRVKTMLEGLVGVIPELISLQVGIDVLNSAMSYDMALICEFETMEALEAYKVNPNHKEISDYVAKVREERACVDFVV